MSIDSPAGCDVCRRQFVEGTYPSAVLDRLDEQHRLYRCGTCGTYWEETERYVVAVDESHVRAEYPEVREPTTPIEEYIQCTPPTAAAASEVAAGEISIVELESWASEARYSPFPKAMKPGDLMLLGDMELTISVARREGNHVVEMTSRGGPRKLLGSFQTEADALRLVAYWIASGFGHDPGANTDLVGATLEEGPISTHLSWPGVSAEFGPRISGGLEAKRFNWARGRSLEGIVNGFGRPLRK